MAEETVEVPVTLTRDGVTAWYADLEWLGLLVHGVPVQGETENEALFCAYRWAGKNRAALDGVRNQLVAQGDLDRMMLSFLTGRPEIRERRR